MKTFKELREAKDLTAVSSWKKKLKNVKGLTKAQLKYNKRGKIVSKKASSRAKKSRTLIKAGYRTKKGKFDAFKKK